MDWEKKTEELFNKIIEKIPEGIRPSVKPMIIKAAENKCNERNGSNINEADLVTGIFDVTPEAFKPTTVEDLTSLGVDVERYIVLKDIMDRIKVSWENIIRAFRPGNVHFAMYLTDRCNMKCLHCAVDDYIPRPELSTKEWFQIIENLETGLQKQGRHGCYIWFGGEPTLREDISEIMKFCKEKGYIHAIITNGVKFDEKFAKMAKHNDMSHVFVSFESADPKKNDEIRGFTNSLEYAEKAIKNCLKYGLFVCTSITIMKQNINELDKLKALSEEWGAETFFRAVVKQNRASEFWDQIGLSQEEYKKLYDFKFKHAIEKIREGEAGTLPIYEIYEMTPFVEEIRDDKELATIEWGIGCLACRTMMGVGVDGTIYPCGYPTKTTLGNALEDSFEDVLNSQLFKDIRDRKKRNGKCASCHHLQYCGGGCRVHAECETGDIFGPFSYCWHENDHDHKRDNSREELIIE
ncbi:MAG: radical SAM protein [Promethearchaeota archaeon]|nr:MAG: radical SAM protein [Candidatus Lokiarchaeota archaeon]